MRAEDELSLGCFTVRFISVCHSIPDGVGLAVETPLGTVVHTGISNWTPPHRRKAHRLQRLHGTGQKGCTPPALGLDERGTRRIHTVGADRGKTLDNIFRLHKDAADHHGLLREQSAPGAAVNRHGDPLQQRIALLGEA